MGSSLEESDTEDKLTVSLLWVSISLRYFLLFFEFWNNVITILSNDIFFITVI